MKRGTQRGAEGGAEGIEGEQGIRVKVQRGYHFLTLATIDLVSDNRESEV